MASSFKYSHGECAAVSLLGNSVQNICSSVHADWNSPESQVMINPSPDSSSLRRCSRNSCWTQKPANHMGISDWAPNPEAKHLNIGIASYLFLIHFSADDFITWWDYFVNDYATSLGKSSLLIYRTLLLYGVGIKTHYLMKFSKLRKSMQFTS